MKKFLKVLLLLVSINSFSFAVEDTPLIIAAEGTKKGNETIAYFCKVVDLIEKDADVNKTGAGGFTPLMRASLSGFLNVVEYLIAKGANVNIQDTINEETALMKVMMKSWGVLKKEEPEAEKRFTFLVKMLLEAGANPNLSNNDGQTPLMWAAAYNLKDIIKLLLQYGADTTIKTKEGKSISDFVPSEEVITFIQQTLSAQFHQALKDKDFATIKYLINAGVDINKFDFNRENNPIIVAAKEGEVPLIEFLISKKANLNAQDVLEKETALYVVVRRSVTQPKKKQEYYLIAEKLLKAGANPNIRNKDGYTPLMIAALGDLYEFMKLLIDYNANKQIKNNLGQIALDIARGQGIEILKNYKKQRRK